MMTICCLTVVRMVSNPAAMYANPIRCSTPMKRRCCARQMMRCRGTSSASFTTMCLRLQWLSHSLL